MEAALLYLSQIVGPEAIIKTVLSYELVEVSLIFVVVSSVIAFSLGFNGFVLFTENIEALRSCLIVYPHRM